MAITSTSLNRTATASGVNLLLTNLRRTNIDLLKTQTELSTGLRVNRPSDDVQVVSAITSLRGLIADFDQRQISLERAGNVADVTDAALADASNILLQAQNIASSQLGVNADATTRKNEAIVIQSLIDSLSEISNREYDGVHLFAGRRSGDQPFVEHLGGKRFVGSSDDLTHSLGTSEPFAINSNGASAFGSLSTRIISPVDLDPAASATTRIADVNGARGIGVTLGTINLDVNGTLTEVDLSSAATLGDVVTLLNDAIGPAGSLAVTANGFTLTANAGQTITISDLGTGVTAADLGIAISATAASTVGSDIDPRLTALSNLSTLGSAVDLTGGLKITNGSTTRTVDFTGAVTVQDLINRIHAADLGVRVEINASGTGLNLYNEISGTALSVGENAGGTTATDLGLRSLDTTTQLTDFNDGLGIRTVSGQADLRIQLSSGATVDVNLDGALTVQDVLNFINTAGGGSVTAALAGDGNGIELTDLSGGAGVFRVLNINGSSAATDLGIAKTGSAGTLTGDDTATITTDSAFTHLIQLRDALISNDNRGITLAAEKLAIDGDRIAQVRAEAGVRSSRIAVQKELAAERKIQSQTLLSGLQDSDYAAAITRFQQLQQQLQASLISGQSLLQTSLLDFLR